MIPSRNRLPRALADATLLAVHEHGVGDLTFEHVAAHAGVPVGKVTGLAASPAGLAGVAMDQVYEEWRDRVPAWLPIPVGGSLAAGLTEILRDTFRGLADLPPVGHLLMLQPHSPVDDVPAGALDPRTVVMNFRAHAEDEFTAWFRQAMERDPTIGAQPQGTDRLCARLIILAMDGFATVRRIEAQADPDPDAYRATLVRVVVEALRAGGG